MKLPCISLSLQSVTVNNGSSSLQALLSSWAFLSSLFYHYYISISQSSLWSFNDCHHVASHHSEPIAKDICHHCGQVEATWIRNSCRLFSSTYVHVPRSLQLLLGQLYIYTLPLHQTNHAHPFETGRMLEFHNWSESCRSVLSASRTNRWWHGAKL